MVDKAQVRIHRRLASVVWHDSNDTDRHTCTRRADEETTLGDFLADAFLGGRVRQANGVAEFQQSAIWRGCGNGGIRASINIKAGKSQKKPDLLPAVAPTHHNHLQYVTRERIDAAGKPEAATCTHLRLLVFPAGSGHWHNGRCRTKCQSGPYIFIPPIVGPANREAA